MTYVTVKNHFPEKQESGSIAAPPEPTAIHLMVRPKNDRDPVGL
jgi:hypothetical protein